jgi:hypothetical protein
LEAKLAWEAVPWVRESKVSEPVPGIPEESAQVLATRGTRQASVPEFGH